MPKGDRYPTMPHIPMPPGLNKRERAVYLRGVCDGIQIVQNTQTACVTELALIGEKLEKRATEEPIPARRTDQ